MSDAYRGWLSAKLIPELLTCLGLPAPIIVCDRLTLGELDAAVDDKAAVLRRRILGLQNYEYVPQGGSRLREED